MDTSLTAVLLAGGLGTRMREETEFKPKPMVEIGGQPVLWHIMKNLSMVNIHEFVVCTGYKGQQIKDYLVARYGDFVLYKPEVKPLTWVLWFGPFLLLALGVIGMALYLRQRQSTQTAQVSLSDDDRRKVQTLLKSGDAP